jgi:hypothetical protein
VRDPVASAFSRCRGDAADLLVAERVLEVVERRAVADAGAEQAGAVVGDDRLGAVAAPAVGGLADVLDDGQQLDALAGSGRGDLVEVRQRRDVRDLVEREQQRRVDRLSGRRGALERGGGDVGDERGEQAAQAALFVRGGDQVERVVAVEQPFGADLVLAGGCFGDRGSCQASRPVATVCIRLERKPVVGVPDRSECFEAGCAPGFGQRVSSSVGSSLVVWRPS